MAKGNLDCEKHTTDLFVLSLEEISLRKKSIVSRASIMGGWNARKQWGLTHTYINKVVGDTTQRISQCSDAVFGYKGCGTAGLGRGEKLETIKAAGGDTSVRLDVFNIYFISWKESAFACLLPYETQSRQLKPAST
ncbi:hypothetical protein J6590_077880 [Homalodisca vitripennis]|nr:hypothetical protein J6590_077880 [Homalodisca vitripennis]